MKRILSALLMAVTLPAAADVTVGMNLVSWHDQPGREAFTPGLYVRTPGDWFVSGGVYRNSQGFTSAHVGAGYSWRRGPWDVSVVAGAVYGYRDEQQWIYTATGAEAFRTYGPPKVLPLLVPSIGYRAADGWSPRVFVIPPGDKQIGTWCVSFAVERNF